MADHFLVLASAELDCVPAAKTGLPRFRKAFPSLIVAAEEDLIEGAGLRRSRSKVEEVYAANSMVVRKLARLRSTPSDRRKPAASDRRKPAAIGR